MYNIETLPYPWECPAWYWAARRGRTWSWPPGCPGNTPRTWSAPVLRHPGPLRRISGVSWRQIFFGRCVHCNLLRVYLSTLYFVWLYSDLWVGGDTLCLTLFIYHILHLCRAWRTDNNTCTVTVLAVGSSLWCKGKGQKQFLLKKSSTSNSKNVSQFSVLCC